VRRAIGDYVARDAGQDNAVTAADVGLLMVAIGAARLGPPGLMAEVEAVLSRQRHRQGIPAGLPQGTYTASKTGWMDGIAHDVALVRPEDRAAYVIAVCVSADADHDSLEAIIRSVSRTVWEEGA
jgi:beta-lactamase class A